MHKHMALLLFTNSNTAKGVTGWPIAPPIWLPVYLWKVNGYMQVHRKLKKKHGITIKWFSHSALNSHNGPM